MPKTTNTDPKVGTYVGTAVADTTCDHCGKIIYKGQPFVEDFITICIACDELLGKDD